MQSVDCHRNRKLVLLVDDRPESRELIADELEDLGFQVVQAVDGKEGWDRFGELSFDCVITDLRMPRSDGLHLLRKNRSPISHKPQVPVLLVSAFGTLPVATEAGNAGATGFYTYDDSGVEELKARVCELLGQSRNHVPLELLGKSTVIEETRGQLLAHSTLKTPVMLCGEVGSGRTAAARFMHESGRPASVPFVELTKGKNNSDELPDSCTIYLNNFDSFAQAEQAFWFGRLLKLETEGAGARQRILVSTSDSLGPLASGGSLDAQLAKHLSRFRIDLPSLRHRIEDFPIILKSLLELAEIRLGRRGFEVAPEALEALAKHNWYENIAECEHVVESIIASSEGRKITLAKVRAALSRVGTPLGRIAAEEAKKERDQLIMLWAQYLSYTGVANAIGVTRNTAKNRMAKYNLVPGREGLPGHQERRR